MVMCKKITQCPICLGEGVMVHKGTRDNGEIDVYWCQECGTRFLSVVDKDYDYENGFMHGDDRLSDADVEERLHALEEDDVRRTKMVKDICKNKTILDFGCGLGGFLQNISEIAKSCGGVELGRFEREYLQKKGVKCYRTIEEWGEEKFDVITLFHVFEHLANPRMWLDKLSKYICTGGHLIIEVPNADDILLSTYESEKFADFTYWSAHLYLYTVRSLSQIVEENGKYDIIEAGQVQRYPISNHLMWLAKGLPGGHHEWNYLDDQKINKAYADKLRELNKCDTLFFILQMK